MLVNRHFLFWVIALLLPLFLLTSCQTGNEQNSTTSIVDASGMHLAAGQIMSLEGQWEFYWQQLLSPQDFNKANALNEGGVLVPVPTSWTSYRLSPELQRLPAYGYATYRLQIELPAGCTSVGLFVPKIWSAAKVYANGELVHQTGQVTTSPEGYENQLLEKLLYLELEEPRLELVVQVACWDLFVSGIQQNFRLGNYQEMYEDKELGNSRTMMWLGVLLVMGLYHLILFFFRRNNYSTLYFAYICFIIAVRLAVFGDHFIYEWLKYCTGWMDYAIQSRLYYISTFALAPVGVLYVKCLYPRQVHRWPVPVINWTFVVLSIFVLLTSPSFFAPFIPVLQGISFTGIGYLVLVVILAALKKERETAFQLIGIVVMVLAGVLDGLKTAGISLFDTLELLPISFGVFLSLQFFIIAKRFSQAFNEVEDLSKNLERKVIQRTEEINQQKEEIEAQRDQLVEKSMALEKAYEHITDSVRYAKRIQNAMLDSEVEGIKGFRESFIFFEPKDIVSGDFYWFSDHDHCQVVVAADCTGHGVPGAFMTLLGTTALNDIVNEKKVLSPDQILYALDDHIREFLNAGNEKGQKVNDGMDVSVLVFDQQNKQVHFAGAKNPLYYVEEGEMKRIKGSIYPIGSSQFKNKKVFEKHTIPLNGNVHYYIFSDGFQDQFGGPQSRKYMSKRFRNFLFENAHLPMAEQQQRLAQEFAQWKNGQPQTDDVLVLGIKC